MILIVDVGDEPRARVINDNDNYNDNGNDNYNDDYDDIYDDNDNDSGNDLFCRGSPQEASYN